MIVRRVYHGIADHFPIRRMEWVMLIPTFGMLVAFLLSPNMFAISPSYRALADFGREQTWAIALFACGMLRTAALTINGTFKSFRLSPHFRAVASAVSLFFWSQFTLGFISAFLHDGGSPSAIACYGTFCAIEVLNFTTSARDIGADVRQATSKGSGA